LSLKKNIEWGADKKFLWTAKSYELERIFGNFFIFKKLFYQTIGGFFLFFFAKNQSSELLKKLLESSELFLTGI